MDRVLLLTEIRIVKNTAGAITLMVSIIKTGVEKTPGPRQSLPDTAGSLHRGHDSVSTPEVWHHRTAEHVHDDRRSQER